MSWLIQDLLSCQQLRTLVFGTSVVRVRNKSSVYTGKKKQSNTLLKYFHNVNKVNIVTIRWLHKCTAELFKWEKKALCSWVVRGTQFQEKTVYVKTPWFNFFLSRLSQDKWGCLCLLNSPLWQFFFCPKPWNIRNYISPSVCWHNPPYITITTIPLTPTALNKKVEEKRAAAINK